MYVFQSNECDIVVMLTILDLARILKISNFAPKGIQPYSSLIHRRPRFLFSLNETLTKQIAFDK